MTPHPRELWERQLMRQAGFDPEADPRRFTWWLCERLDKAADEIERLKGSSVGGWNRPRGYSVPAQHIPSSKNEIDPQPETR